MLPGTELSRTAKGSPHARGAPPPAPALDRHAQDARGLGVEAGMISKLAGPRGLDPHQINRISKTSLNLYRRAAETFSDWLEKYQLFPSDAESWHDCLVEWKNGLRNS